MALFRLLMVVFSVTDFVVSQNRGLQLSVVTDGTYSIKVNNKVWLTSAPTYFMADGLMHINGNLSLKQSSATSGYDKIGEWQTTDFYYTVGSSNITASIKTYPFELENDFIVFSQTYHNGAQRTNRPDVNSVIGRFPAFNVGSQEANVNLYYLAYGGIMVGDTGKSIGVWNTTSVSMAYGISGGPLAIFDRDGNTVIIAPFSQFMASSVTHPDFDKSVGWGVMGGVKLVPPGYQCDTILYYAKGINKAFEGWGRLMKKWYGRTDEFVRTDLTISHLGYWTDNGAYYYYLTEQNKTYEDTMLDVKKYADSQNIPYRYFQFDSWWYYKGEGNGVKDWDSRPDVFPHGLNALIHQLGLPVALHNRFWAKDTVYAVQNRGRYLFEIDRDANVSAPLTQNFWNYLLGHAKEDWDLVLYEQDWLNVEFAGLPSFLNGISLGKLWLQQMADAAKLLQIPIQYCMSNPRHAMMALELNVVTQARVSGDYHPGRDQWRIGVSSMFADAIGIRPYKDTFWTTTTQPGNSYKSSEPYPGLNAVVSTLSTGPVGPGDMVGGTNVSLLMRCCNTDGRILKPSKPATAIDRQMILTATKVTNNMEVWSTYSEMTVENQLKYFGTVLGVDTIPHFKVMKTDLDFVMNNPHDEYMVYEYRSPQIIKSFTPTLAMENCTRADFCLFHFIPRISFGIHSLFLLGETSKWIPVSQQRISAITPIQDTDVVLTVEGVQGESVVISYLLDGISQTVTCNFKVTSSLLLSIINKTC
ncbi:uncharacterized protein LOC125678812 [Ostrea edulis]|uniref:uncharacterized protein LOC125678812 n=1 Tax=Ostrea edulis TaxID=37623 RepID=UPI0024AF7207|nr:uncharacterized protein LOC125678812 [Ostrea edulis]